jgi:hypothetical protein
VTKIVSLERLLEENIVLRQNSETALTAQITAHKERTAQLEDVVAKLESKIKTDKMVLKFRDSTIARINSGTDDSDTEKEELR